MSWDNWVAPAVVAALISGSITVVSVWMNRATTMKVHKEKLDADRELAERKFKLDHQLVESKFNFDIDRVSTGKKQELAEDVLSGFLEVRDMFRAIRLMNPLILARL